MSEQKMLTVDTPLGKLCACIFDNKNNFPGIHIYLEREDKEKIKLVQVEVEKDKELAAYLFGDTSQPEYTEVRTWTKNEINRR